MTRIGITGGIGSGKTTVSRIFEALGIPVYYADAAARLLMNTDPDIRKKVIREFGNAAYRENELDRKFLGSIVFDNAEKLAKLNAITHPATIRHAEAWIRQQRTNYIVKEAALLFESGSATGLDHIVGVYAPLELRIKRVMQRDKLSREEVEKRISRQMDEETKMKLCDFVINNNEEQLLLPQVLLLHSRFGRRN